MALPALIAAGAGAVLGRFTLAAGVAAGVIAGILRVITLLGIGVAVYEGIDTLLPYVESGLSSATGYSSGNSAAYAALGQVFDLMKVQEAISLLAGAIGTRITFRFGMILTRGQGGA